MKLSNKNQNNQQASVTFSKGLNLSNPGTQIEDQELQECVNLFYSNQELYLTTRSGIKIMDVPQHSHAIEKLYEYVKDESSSYLVMVSNGSLYYMNTVETSGVESTTWEKITDLTSNTITPCFATYNRKLVIADRGATLRSWDGTEVAAVSGSPSYATIVETINGRLVCNSEATGELDAVYFTAPYSLDNWDTNNGAVGMRAGYGDGRKVTGLGVLANDLIVFKDGGLTYRVSCQGSTGNWYVQKLFSNNSCSNQASIEPVGNDVVFGSSTGINSVQTVQEYGDIKVASLGMKIMPKLNGKQVRESVWSTYCGVLFLLIEGTDEIFVYHPHNAAFTTFDYGIRVNSICNGKDYTYFSDNTGKVYRSTNLGYDELTEGVFTPIVSKLMSKTFTVTDEMLLKNSRVYLEQIDATKGAISVVDKSQQEITELYSWLPSFAGFLYDADNALVSADTYLYGDAQSYFDINTRYREQAFSFRIDLSEGRAKLKNIDMNFAIVT